MDGEKLVFTLRKPFDVLVENSKTGKWLGIMHELRTSRTGEIRCFQEVFRGANVGELMSQVA
jgi:hypothetical protein